MKQFTLIVLLLVAHITSVFGQNEVSYKDKQQYKNWVRLAPKLEDSFFQTQEAIRIAENVLLYQLNTGGWPKNIYMPAELSATEKKAVIAAQKDENESTIDNGATSTEIQYLARIYNVTKDERYKKAVIRGLEYLFKAQYPNGGWPQFYPRPKGYYTQITYNDNAMLNVLQLIRKVYEKQEPYTFLPENMVEKARKSFDLGIECILKTQVRINGKLTVWCAQHDHVTLLPAKARAYELPSLSGQESDNLVLLLMSLPSPSEEIKNAIEGAVEWFKQAKIEGLTKEYFTDSEGRKDYRMVSCTDCEPLWARFYDLETGKAFFCDRDGVKVDSVSKIGYERRNGYSWYNNDGSKVIRDYEKWKKRNNF
ncbi:MAG: pectate lyase [Bacteroides graminisolvens]|nr:pectate lyase [Bacteroides graminisolvens]